MIEWLYEMITGKCWHHYTLRKRWKNGEDKTFLVCYKCGDLK